MAISSWCMIFGPGLAIRGPDGSMSRAVAGMYQERKWALRFFWLGICFIMLSGIALARATQGGLRCPFNFSDWRLNESANPSRLRELEER